MTKANVVVKCDYRLSLNNNDRNKKYNNKDITYVDNMLDYFSNDEKRISNMLDYFTGKINKHEDINLILENGHYATKEEIEKRKKYINKQFKNSNVWQIMISPSKELVDENINWHDLELKMAKEIIPRILKKMGFQDIKKMMYQFSLHTNKESHPHFHVSFLEKSPNTLDINNNLMYRRKGKVDKSIVKFIKQEVNIAIEREKKFKPYSIEINKEIEEFKKYFSPDTKNFFIYNNKNIILEEKILNLGRLLNEKEISHNNKIKFASIKDEEIKKLTKDIKEDLFKVNNDLIITKYDFNNKIKQMNDYLIDIGKRNQIKKKHIDLSYTKNKELYLNNYILNAIVNHSRYYYRKESSKFFTSNDVIHAIILNNYKNNKEYSKKEILHNHLSNLPAEKKYKMRNNVRSAIKNINYEMEEASKEFSKLFCNENEKNL